MDMQDQTRFIQELGNNITQEIVDLINKGGIPDTWDGLELRQLFADHAAYATYPMTKGRKREYNNTVLVNNL